MIIRIVKMTFKETETENFERLFDSHKARIRNFEGCHHLELWQDVARPNVFFTYSHWQSETALEAYRHSELFSKIWTATKTLFADKPQAWSVTQKQVVEC